MGKHPELIRLQKHQWIADISAGKSFADVGGLWGAVNETVTIAHDAGASSVAMIDVQGPESRWWEEFRKRAQEYGVEDCQEIVADVMSEADVAQLPKFDVVHCSGILYHVSDPLALIRNLWSITNEYLVLGSMLIPDRIENDSGVLLSPPGTAHCVPVLDDTTRTILAEYYTAKNIRVGGVNADRPEFVRPSDGHVRTGPWWYLFTAETMTRWCELFGMEVVDAFITKQGAQNVLCRINSQTDAK